MILQQLNYLHVIVAAIAYFAVGAVWFTPIGFAKPWMEGYGITMPTDPEIQKKMKKEMPKYMGITLVLCFVGTVALACLQGVIGTNGVMSGVKLGIAAGSFVGVAFAMSHLHTRKSFKLTLIDSGYHIVGLSIASIILSVWH